jgi:HAD superfamily hydrolase (TIGR01549 family)
MTAHHDVAVVFDLDGTLVDTMTSAPQAYANTIRSLGGPEVSPSEVVAVWHIGPTPVVLEHFLGRPISPRDTERFHRHFAAVVATVEPFPGVVDMLDALSRSGHRLGVFTTATRRAATSVLMAADLAGYFPVVVGGDEVSRSKPAPDGLELSCRRLGTGVTEAVYVGDAAVDLECAEAANASGIHAAWGSVNGTAPMPARIAQRPHDVVELVRHLQTQSSRRFRQVDPWTMT